MAVQPLDLFLHSGLLKFKPPSDLPSSFAFQLKINPRLNENHAISRLNHTLLAALHVLPIGATYPPSKEILKFVLALKLALSPLPSWVPKPDSERNRVRSWNQALDFPCSSAGSAFTRTSSDPVQLIALYPL